jgi:multidrug resistance efflux pump
MVRPSMSRPGVVEEVMAGEGDQVRPPGLVRLQGTEDLTAAVSAADFEVTSAQKALDDLNDSVESKQDQYLLAISQATDLFRDAQYQLDNFTSPQEQTKMGAMQALDLMKERLDAARATFEPYKYYPSTNDTREDLKEEFVRDYETWKEGPDPKEVAFIEARLATAKTTLAAAQAALDDLDLRAPFSGTVSELDIRVGEFVNPGQPVLLLADLQHLRIETTDLNEIDAARVEVNGTATVTFDALPGVVVKGTVTSIAPKSSAGSGVNYKVLIELAEIPAALRWGMTAFVDIEVK